MNDMPALSERSQFYSRVYIQGVQHTQANTHSTFEWPRIYLYFFTGITIFNVFSTYKYFFYIP